MDKGFSESFNYSVWTANTDLTLAYVPWNSTYKDAIDYENRAHADRLINESPYARTISFTQRARVNEPIIVDIPHNDVMGYNYIRATNGAQSAIQGDRRTSYYYFILGSRSISSHTTELTLQLDVWTSFFDRITFGWCFLDRGHKALANQNAFNNYGLDYLTIPEGIDYGVEYVPRMTETNKIMRAFNNNYSILVGVTQDLESDPGANYETAKVNTAKGSLVQGLPSGPAFYVFDSPANFMHFMEEWSEKSWVANSIVSISAIPAMNRYIDDWNRAEWISGELRAQRAPEGHIPIKTYNAVNNWRDELKSQIPAQYRKFLKLLTFPYSFVEMTTFTGQPMILKPESWQHDHASYRETISILPPGQRISFYPVGYNQRPGLEDIPPSQIPGNNGDDQGDYLDRAIHIGNFPTFAMVNSGSAAVLASQRYGISYARESADYAADKTARGNQLSYDQATAGIGLANDMTALQNKDAQQALHISSGADSWRQGVGTAESLLNLSVGSSIFGGIQGGINAREQADLMRHNQNINNEASGLQGANAEYVRDSNKGLADWAAKGDYESTIAGIQANVNSASMIAPTTVGQIGGEIFNMVNDSFQLGLRFKTISDSAMHRVCSHWARYGYTANRYTQITQLSVMSHFSYWRTQETHIAGQGVPEGIRLAIAGMFEKGVTFWKHPEDIGMIDPLINTPLEGVTL